MISQYFNPQLNKPKNMTPQSKKFVKNEQIQAARVCYIEELPIPRELAYDLLFASFSLQIRGILNHFRIVQNRDFYTAAFVLFLKYF